MFRKRKHAIYTFVICAGVLAGIQLLGSLSHVSQDAARSWRSVSYKGRELVHELSMHTFKMNSTWTKDSDLIYKNSSHVSAGETYEMTSHEEEEEGVHGDHDEVPLPYEAIHDQYFKIKRRQAMLYGRIRNYTSYLTIGIPTVKRNGVSYLEKTLSMLAKSTPNADKKDVVVVVFFTDNDHDWIIQEAKNIYNQFTADVESGFIQIVHPHHNSYPNFTRLERTFNDSTERVAWRSKQNLDYSYLVTYSQGFSTYYLQIEDDVMCLGTYLRDIRRYLMSRKDNRWFVISFSRLGFIGKLFRSKDLSILADFLLMFFAEKPCDILLNDLRLIKGQKKDIYYRPSLFQHIGIVSSLKNKKQLLIDKGFRGKALNRKTYYHDNPDATLETNMEVYEDYILRNAYTISESYFWAVSPKNGTYLRIVFKTPQMLDRIYIASGMKAKPNDVLSHAEVNVAVRSLRDNALYRQSVGEFKVGKFDTKEYNITLPENIECVSVSVTEDHENWVIINEIALFNP